MLGASCNPCCPQTCTATGARALWQSLQAGTMTVEFTTATFPAQHCAAVGTFAGLASTAAGALSALTTNTYYDWHNANAVPGTTPITLALDMSTGLNGTYWDAASGLGQVRWVFDNGDYAVTATQRVQTDAALGPPYYTGTKCHAALSFDVILRRQTVSFSTAGPRAIVQSSLSVTKPAAWTHYAAIRAGAKFGRVTNYSSAQPNMWHVDGQTGSAFVVLHDRPDNYTLRTGWDGFTTTGGTVNWSTAARTVYYQRTKSRSGTLTPAFSGQTMTAAIATTTTVTDAAIAQWDATGGLVANPRAGTTLYWDAGVGALYPLVSDPTGVGFADDYRTVSYAGKVSFTW